MPEPYPILILILLTVCVMLLVILLFLLLKGRKQPMDRTLLESLKDELADSQSGLRQELSATVQGSVKTLGELVSSNQQAVSELQSRRLAEIDRTIADKQEALSRSLQGQLSQLSLHITENQKIAAMNQAQKLDDMERAMSTRQTLMTQNVQTQMKQLEERFKTLESTNNQNLSEMRETISKRLSYIQEDNNKKLDEIRATVDDKLQKTLEEKMTSSFELVSQRLEQVYKGLGEMQTIASGVGDLKKVLSNVKTRGILGEIQLSAILSEILRPEQYDTEVATIPGSRDHVEFAVKLPAKDSGDFIYLPIDSKFPGDTYSALQDAYENGDPEQIKLAYKNLEIVIKKSAKDIHDKYIAPPHTTNFAIMFLPFEGLYAEVVNHGLVEILQRDYAVNIAGPSTMAAMLNALQMGFKTLQIQKRSSEIGDVLSAVKAEFETFGKVFDSAKNRIRQLDEDMDKLIGTRTRAIQRKLRSIQASDLSESDKLLEIDDAE